MDNINHLELSFPALLKIGKGPQIIWEANQAFNDYFPELITNGLANPLYSELFFKKINEEKKIHWKGILYHVDVLHPNNKDRLYLLSPSKESVSQSFLWLKHDLTNILNPILGFSDMMSNDEKFDEEDHLILQKINENSLIMFQQFQRISQLQKIGQLQVDTQTGSYSLRNYLSELSDKLLVDNDLSTDAEINIENACLVPDFITLHQFRSVIEDQLSYFCKQQKQAKLCIRTQQESQKQGIYFHFPLCQLDPQILETFNQIENFVSGISPIHKLQIPSLNYLLLCELTKLAGGYVNIDYSEEEVILKLVLPLKESQEEIQKRQKSQSS